MKLVPAIIFIYFMFITTIIFNGLVPAQAKYGYTLINNTTIQNSSAPFSTQTYYAFWNIFINPTELSTNAIWSLLVLSILGLGVGVMISLATKSDLGSLLAVFVIIFGSGVLAMIPVYHILYADTYALSIASGTEGCSYVNVDNYGSCKPPIILSALVFGPFALYWFFVCLEWWSARSTS